MCRSALNVCDCQFLVMKKKEVWVCLIFLDILKEISTLYVCIRGKLLQMVQRLVHNLNTNQTMVSVFTVRVEYRHFTVKIRSHGPFVRIEYKNDSSNADEIITQVAAELLEDNPDYNYSPLEIHDGSSGHREGLITFYEKG